MIVLHEWWGVNAQMAAIARRWAAEGFIALAPDLYHGTVIPVGDAAAAGAAMKALDFGAAVRDIAAAVAELRADPRCNGEVAVTGYCMGGALTLAAAVEIPGLAAVVPFYGTPGARDWSQVTAPIQAHFALHDTWATVTAAQAIQAAIEAAGTTTMELHVYDAQHAFCNEARPEVHDATAAATAWSRAVAFVRAHTTR